ncbi:2-phospho-L-lactate transferase [Salipiger sp. P9]|uniref:2-phospho-L-lactate transferase n=1 Tax=Salipiger pentaromativorans TaxID=2943193 RepID=UPI00215874DB|nr:2-phospho-L-lactate transferase [Salipiger pentaromativorans]MCR8547512.1 2-phospho-L-lactate transferase [Salipiger pentaromativorans]
MSGPRKIVALSGGVGGAKLAFGLDRALPAGALSVIVNTGDDFTHLGLPISPDIDTLLYTLSGLNDTRRGWGRAGESWAFMETLRELGGEDWFQLGDRDLALHVLRGAMLASGQDLTQVTAALAARMGIAAKVLPMSDAPSPTLVETPDGALEFQRYFVEQRCAPVVTGLRHGAAAPSPAVLAALADPALAGIVICPSNPWLSIDPILALPGLSEALRASSAPVVAVSPLVGGQAVKGPTAKIMAELGLPVTNASIAAHYAGLIDGLVIDRADAGDAGALPLPVAVEETLMTDDARKIALAGRVLGFLDTLREGA